MCPKRFLKVLVLMIIFVSVGGVALADAAPPEQPPGGNPLLEGGGSTMVRMQAEEVIIEVGDVGQLYYSEMNLATVNANVTATFWMINTGTSVEEMLVRFPLSNYYGLGDGYSSFPEIQNFTIQVDNQYVDWMYVESQNPRDPNDQPVLWAGFDVQFPPSEEVVLTVHYDVQSTGYLPVVRFNYILETGAGWYGTIGEGDIILRLPYEATSNNVLLGDGTSAGGEFVGNDVRWHFEELEPTSDNNWEVRIIDPATWQSVVDYREVLEDDPENIEAFFSLGEAYERILFPRWIWVVRGGTEGLLDQIEELYRQLIELRPQNSEAYERYAFVLLGKYYYARNHDIDAPTADEIASALNMAVYLDPENVDAHVLYAELENVSDRDFPTPGASPTPGPTDTPTVTPTASATATQEQEPEPINTPAGSEGTDEGSSSIWPLSRMGVTFAVICVGILLLVLAAAVITFVVWQTRRPSRIDG